MKNVNTEIDYKEKFKYESKLFKETLKQIDDLYKETKAHLDAIKNNRIPRSLNFINCQTTNLIALRNAKINILKERVNLKKVVEELKLKVKDTESTANSNLLNSIFSKLIKEENINEEYEDDNNEESYDEKDIENILDKKIKKYKNEGNINLEYTICVEINRKKNKYKIIAIDENNKKYYKSTDTINIPDSKEIDLKIKKINGTIKAFDRYGNTFKIVYI